MHTCYNEFVLYICKYNFVKLYSETCILSWLPNEPGNVFNLDRLPSHNLKFFFLYWDVLYCLPNCLKVQIMVLKCRSSCIVLQQTNIKMFYVYNLSLYLSIYVYVCIFMYIIYRPLDISICMYTCVSMIIFLVKFTWLSDYT